MPEYSVQIAASGAAKEWFPRLAGTVWWLALAAFCLPGLQLIWNMAYGCAVNLLL